MEKYTYLEGTIKLSDGKPAVRINWEDKTVEEPSAEEAPSNWRTPEIPVYRLKNIRDRKTPISEYVVYAAFLMTLIRNNVVDKWIEAGGDITDTNGKMIKNKNGEWEFKFNF